MSNHTFIYYEMSLMAKVATCKHYILLIRAAAGHNITLSRSSAGHNITLSRSSAAHALCAAGHCCDLGECTRP